MGMPAAAWPVVGRHEELDVLDAALRDPGSWGAVVVGPAGVGKTRLAERSLAPVEAGPGSRRVLRASASRAAATVPLGALLHILPAGMADAASPFERAAADLRTPAGPGPIVFVDDLHLLDATSVLLLSQLLTAGVITLLATVRLGETGAASDLWRNERIVRVDLADLSPDALDTLLHLVLGGPAAAGTVASLWETSRGNPLFLHELVLGARAGGRLVESDGVWHLTDTAGTTNTADPDASVRTGGLVSTTARLVEVVEARLPRVGDPGRPAVELLALAQPVDVGELDELVGLAVLEDLERAGVIEVRADRRRQQAALAHPLYGEVVRANLPTLTRRRLLLDHADRIERTGARRRGDALELAAARLGATGTADADLLIAAARLARYGHDFDEVIRLTRAALGEQPTAPSAEAQLLLGEALYERWRYAEAEEVLSAAVPDSGAGPGAGSGIGPADGGEHHLALVTTRVNNLVWGLLRTDDALAVNRAAQARITSSAVRDELVAEGAIVHMVAGRPADALRALAPLDPTSVDPRVRVLRAIAEVPALTQTGRPETALALARQGLTDHVALGDQVAIAHEGIHLINRASALVESGRLPSAERLAESCYRHSAAERSAIGQMWFSLVLGRCALLQGRPVTALTWLAASTTFSRNAGLVGPLRVALAARAMAAAWKGDAAASQAAISELDGLPEFGYFRSEQEIGRAWALIAAGFPEEARTVLAAGAEQAAAAGHHSAEAWLLHDLARLGHPASGARAADRLEVLAAEGEGALFAAYATHARALAGDDAAQLASACDRFEAIGALLLAAEAATAAGLAFQRRGEARSATAAHTRASALAARCEGARTSGLLVAAVVVPLTRREREIAVLARDGVSNREIAERLYLSVRTVHSHLHNAYTKLGVTSRSELASALAAHGASPPEEGTASPRP